MSTIPITEKRWQVEFPPKPDRGPQSGVVEAIYIGPERKQPMLAVEECRVKPGMGLQGDRYYKHAGTFSKRLMPERELTLIEAEAVEAFVAEHGVEFTAQDSRRNVVTRGVALNHLVGREFFIGDVKMRGIKLCQPCSHLKKLTEKPVLPGLYNRGGLNAQVLDEGVLHVGDKLVAPADERNSS